MVDGGSAARGCCRRCPARQPWPVNTLLRVKTAATCHMRPHPFPPKWACAAGVPGGQNCLLLFVATQLLAPSKNSGISSAETAYQHLHEKVAGDGRHFQPTAHGDGAAHATAAAPPGGDSIYQQPNNQLIASAPQLVTHSAPVAAAHKAGTAPRHRHAPAPWRSGAPWPPPHRARRRSPAGAQRFWKLV